ASPREHGGPGVGGLAAQQEPGAAREDGAQRGGDSGWSPPSRSRQYAAALADICAAWLGGGTGRPARPLFVVNVDLAQVQLNSDGTVALAVRGDLPRISAAALERLVNDADLKAVLFDGARPLAASRKTRMRDIPQATRTAIAARDRGCRFPGSPDPLAHTDIHHLKERSRGGDHSPDNLAALSRRFHTLVHERGWTLILHPDSGQITARRGERAWTSMPKGTRLAQPEDPADAVGLGEPAAEVRGRPPDPARPSPGRGPGDDASNGHDPPMAYPRDPSLPF
ncbi:MAG TPA: HNH endonuclease signature motif containing protein, partial [Egibacteraceae bacterium]|nr:HNH endonuclease signature motif containing protein [Egibacteraceae bacterium]